MYSRAFVSDDVEFIVTEALKTIPAESKYHKSMQDVINWDHKYPDDWIIKRSQEICWKYGLPIGKHVLSLKWNNPEDNAEIYCGEIIVYADKPRIK